MRRYAAETNVATHRESPMRPGGPRRRMLWLTLALVMAAAVLAAGLFVAGAMWRARMTIG